MANIKRIVGDVIVSAPVDTTPTEASVRDSAHTVIRQAFTQLERALEAFGPFELGSDMTFVSAGIRLDVLTTTSKQGVTFDDTAFGAFLRHAHSSCSMATDTPGATSEQIADAAEKFALEEDRDLGVINALFNSLAACSGASIISTDGELIKMGVGSPPMTDDDHDPEIDVARIMYLVRIKTTGESYDVPANVAEGLQVGQYISFKEVEPPSGVACVRAARIDAVDPTGELFANSVATQVDGDPDDGE